MNTTALPFGRTINTIRRTVKSLHTPAVTQVAEKSRDPFRVLVSCLISLRTKDEVTAAASARLFDSARTPQEMVKLSEGKIARLIFPAGFYRTKSRTIREVSRNLIEQYAGRVPDAIEELVKLKGVGRKTANLVVTLGFGKPGICVDTHVHRISNRLGWVQTTTPEKTEVALRRSLPRRYWIEINDLLVTFGQSLCQPVSPWCSKCPLNQRCPRIGVIRNR